MKRLIDILPIEEGKVVTVVGAGGKTSTISYLAQKLKMEKLIVTTTTHFLSFNSFPHKEIIEDDYQILLKETEKALQNKEKVILGKERLETAPGMTEGKINGLPAEWIDDLAVTFPEAVILVEGDGSADKPIKAPANHEPVVPSSTDLLMPVLGMKVLGKKVNKFNCHRVEELLKLMNSEKGETYINHDLIVEILTSSDSYGCYHSKVKDYIPLLNQVEDYNLESVMKIASSLNKTGLEKVILMDTHEEEPLQKMSVKDSIE